MQLIFITGHVYVWSVSNKMVSGSRNEHYTHNWFIDDSSIIFTSGNIKSFIKGSRVFPWNPNHGKFYVQAYQMSK